MRRRVGIGTEVVRGEVISSRVIQLDPSDASRRETEFRFEVAEVVAGLLQPGEVLIAAFGSVVSLLPVGVEHIVFLHPTRPSGGYERYAVLGGPHGRFALEGDVYRQECFRRGTVVEVAEMARDRFESILSEAIRPPTSSTP
jgi:hypothetical protein